MSTTTEVNEKPILFNSDMVRAILDGRKTQTRRVMKPQPSEEWEPHDYGVVQKLVNGVPDIDKPIGWGPTNDDGLEAYKCPYGKPGDELWVRETFAFLKKHDQKPPSDIYDNKILYRADGKITNRFGLGTNLHETDFGRWRPSIHMPREASRIQLTVIDIRVERVQEISEDDALDEGIDMESDHASLCINIQDATYSNDLPRGSAVLAVFERLWNSINAKRGYWWETNPWVWVVEFKVKEVKT